MTLASPAEKVYHTGLREGGVTWNTGGYPPKEALCSSLPNADNRIIPEGLNEDQMLSF